MSRSDAWDFYLDGSARWRWSRKASNGEVVGASHQSYSRKADCEENAVRAGWAHPDFLLESCIDEMETLLSDLREILLLDGPGEEGE